MTLDASPDDVRRRSFLSRFGAGLAALSAAFVPAAARAAEPQGTARWSPTRHEQDEWLEAVPGQHRFFFDAISPKGAGEAIAFATNYYAASQTGYGLGNADLAVVICLRHWATPFAFTDAVWAKYGAPLAERIQFMDPKTNAPPTTNVYQATTYGMQLPNRGVTLNAMIRRGTHFAVCDMATRVFAGVAAQATGGSRQAVYDEMRANAIANTHFVPAGIVAVNRAQERQYAIQFIG